MIRRVYGYIAAFWGDPFAAGLEGEGFAAPDIVAQ